MKRIQYACLNQTIHFKLKEDIPREWALRMVQDEYAAYKKHLIDRKIPHKILSEETKEDGSILIQIKRQVNQYDVGTYLDLKSTVFRKNIRKTVPFLCMWFYLQMSAMTCAYISMVLIRCALMAYSSGPCMLLFTPGKAAPKDTPPSRWWT